MRANQLTKGNYIMENSENSKFPLIYQKISAVMAEVPAISKSKRNAQQGFNYRGIDDVQNALQDILPRHGVFYVPEVLESRREERQTKTGGNLIYTVLKVRYTFYAEDGSHVSAVVQSEGMDSADKSSNKAMSAACKYAMFQVLNIPTEEAVDPDATTPPESRAAGQAQQPAQAAAQAPQAFDEDAFLNGFNGVKEACVQMSAANAEKVTDSEGVPYGMIPTKDLRFRLNALIKSLRENHLSDEMRQDKQFKLGVINAILLDRKAHRANKK